MYHTQHLKQSAVYGRDKNADGHFVYAVSTTGIYCKPSCPSRRPKAENILFFATPSQAEQAGYRPCRRCHPNQGSSDLVAAIQTCLHENPDLSLSALGDIFDLSPFYLQRKFKQATGLSPKAYSRALKLEQIKQSLQSGKKVTEAIYDAGFESGVYQHDYLGMTPSSYRKGGMYQTIFYTLTSTKLGTMLLAATARGVCAIRFGHEALMLEEIRKEFPNATLLEDSEVLNTYIQAINTYLEGETQLDLPLDLAGTVFQYKVWQVLQKIPHGQTRSYAQVAEAVGTPKAVRAVASACASNPVALAVPCHRVVRANGELSGYRWGLDRKQWLLEHEQTKVGLFDSSEVTSKTLGEPKTF